MDWDGLQRDRSVMGGYSDKSPQESLRFRTRPSNIADQGPPQFNWNPDQREDETRQDLKGLPLPMALKKIHLALKLCIPLCHEGHFGGGVQSYFLFLRFLVVLNFFSFLLIASFVLVPSIVYQSRYSGSNNEVNISAGKEECTIYDPNPQGLVYFYSYFIDLLTGTGFMEYSYLFYGYYNNTEKITDESFYNIPLAYLLTAGFYVIFCLICIVIRMGGAVRIAVKTGGKSAGGYSLQVFTGWDYGLQGNRAIRLKQNNIRYHLQVDLEEERIKLKAASLPLSQIIRLYSVRAFLNLVVLALIGGSFYAIFLATEFSQAYEGTDFLSLVVEYLPSIVITMANFLVPFLCDQIALLEKHSPSTTIILALLRAVFLRLVGLGVLLFTLWSQITCRSAERGTCQPCGYNHALYPCWETRVGQEMYKLAIFDFITVIAVLVLVEFPRRMIVDNFSCKLAKFVGRQEFVVPQNVLGLVYGQTVVWVGALFCPLLPVINTIKFFIIFYCKKVTLFYNCRPMTRTFRSTSSNFFLPLCASLWLDSGLFDSAVQRGSNSYVIELWPLRSLSTMWSVVPNSFNSLSETTREFLFFIGSQAFSVPLFLLSCVVLAYFAALASLYGQSVSLLRAQLKLEGRDKKILGKAD